MYDVGFKFAGLGFAGFRVLDFGLVAGPGMDGLSETALGH